MGMGVSQYLVARGPGDRRPLSNDPGWATGRVLQTVTQHLLNPAHMIVHELIVSWFEAVQLHIGSTNELALLRWVLMHLNRTLD